MQHIRCTNPPDFIGNADRPDRVWPNLLAPQIWQAHENHGADVTSPAVKSQVQGHTVIDMQSVRSAGSPVAA